MSAPHTGDARSNAEERFVERVMVALARQERRLPRIALALLASALVLSVPALAKRVGTCS